MCVCDRIIIQSERTASAKFLKWRCASCVQISAIRLCHWRVKSRKAINDRVREGVRSQMI